MIYNLLEDFFDSLAEGALLAIMPISRVTMCLEPINYQFGITFYPAGSVDLSTLGYIPNRERGDGVTLWEHQLAASRVTLDDFEENTLVVFPCSLNWSEFRKLNLKGYMRLIRKLSSWVDNALDVVRYYECELDNFHSLPDKAGTTNLNPMMSAAMLFNPECHEARIIAGDAFASRLTRGLGLPLVRIEEDRYPQDGEVGKIARHAMSLLSSAMENPNYTTKFTQCISLLEFLANPGEYTKFGDVKKIVSRYIAKDEKAYQKLLERFYDLTGRKDEETGQYVGMRTRIVHLGEKIEDIVPEDSKLHELFVELQFYIKKVIDHMIVYSYLTWDEYLVQRDALRNY